MSNAKAIKFLNELYDTANSDKDGDAFFRKEFEFFKKINGMIAKLREEDKLITEATDLLETMADDLEERGMYINRQNNARKLVIKLRKERSN